MFVLTHLGVVARLPWKPCMLVLTSKVSVVTKLLYPRGIKYKHHLEHPIFKSGVLNKIMSVDELNVCIVSYR